MTTIKFNGKRETAPISPAARQEDPKLSSASYPAAIDALQPENAPHPDLNPNRVSKGLNLLKIPPFLALGQPHNDNDYYRTGQVINPGSQEDDQLIFIRPKQSGVEPGFEAVFLKDLKQGGSLHYLAKDADLNDDAARGTLIQDLLDNHKRDLTKGLYFVKLDYSKDEGKDTVQILRKKAHNAIHQLTTRDSTTNKNNGAILEVAAADVLRQCGLNTADTHLILCQYADGSPKMLVASKCVTGPEGEPWADLIGKIKYGQLAGNRIIAQKEDGTFTSYLLDKKELALAKATQRAVGDCDGVGNSGANIGYYVDSLAAGEPKARIVNIDPGKSLEPSPTHSPQNKLELLSLQKNNFAIRFLYKIWLDLKTVIIGKTDRMMAQDFHSDCTFTRKIGTLKDLFQGKYANFSVFDDISLADNMAAMKFLLAQRESVNLIFDAYKREFEATLAPAQSEKEIYCQTIEDAKKRFNDRLDYFENVLGPRLDLNTAQLTVLENLEKLTSDTTNVAGGKKDGIALLHLKVIPGTRKIWNVEGENFVYQAKNKRDLKRVAKKLEDFNQKQRLPIFIDRKTNQIKILDSRTDPNALKEIFDEQEIAAYKGQYLYSQDQIFKLNGSVYSLKKMKDCKAIVTTITLGAQNKTQSASAKAVVRTAIAIKLAKYEAELKRLAPSERKSRLEEKTETYQALLTKL